MCPNCGAKVLTDENTVATHCVYCGNTAIMKNRLQGEFKPDKIIPFKTEKKDAVKAFQENVQKKWFAPKEFHLEENIEKITGVYVPFWLYDGKVNGNISAKATKTRFWSDSNYNYTEISEFECTRSGNIEITDLPVDGSSKFEDNIMDSIEPYDYNEFVEFNRAYLSGFLAEKYDLDKETVYVRAEDRMKNTITNELKSTIGGYTSITIQNSDADIQKGDVEYALLPVWMLNIKFKEKMYTFAMNGQTKKMVGDVPVDVKCLTCKSLVCFAIITIICSLVALIGGSLL